MSLITIDVSNLAPPKEFKEYMIVPEHSCGKSELDFGNGFHLCKEENVNHHIFTMTFRDVIERLKEERPDLIIDSSNINMDNWLLSDYLKIHSTDTRNHKATYSYRDMQNELPF